MIWKDGKPLFDYAPNGQQSFKIKDMKKFEKEYAKLAETHKDMLNDINENKKEFEEFLEKESDIQLKTVSIDDLPEDISASFLEKIGVMID